MNPENSITVNNKWSKKDKILLMTLPFLTPLIPPMGITCLKSYLQKYGYHVKTIDGMAEMSLREICYIYFDKLEKFVPEKKRGFFFNVGLDVFYNHFMAHLNQSDTEKFHQLVKLLVYRNFYVEATDEMVIDLDKIVSDFFAALETYIVKVMTEEKPAILGFSVFKGTLGPTLFASRLIKEKWPEIEVIVGGSIFSQDLLPGTPNFESFLKRTPYIDRIFIGEGENLFHRYLEGNLPGGRRIYNFEDIGNKLIDLNSLDVPDFSDCDISAYPLLGSYTSRGCVYKCSFCAETLFWKKYNRKKVEKIVDDLDYLSNKYRKNVFVFTDCLINPLVSNLAKEIIRRKLNVYWDVTLKVDKQTCQSEYTMLWRQGGFYRARLGIESGSQKLLDIISKKITIQQIKDSLINLATAGIKTTAYIIAGHPGETEEDFQQTLDMLEEMQDYIFEVEVDPFRFFYSGQVHTDIWGDKRLLYPEDDTDMLLTQTWILNEEPSRPEIYSRACRIKEHCKKLGIPNPYSISEIQEADQRWKRLHKNAVPPLMQLNREFQNIKEKIQTTMLRVGDNSEEDEVDFNF